MELEIQTETGSVLKPVMNAAKRTLKTGVVDVGKDGLRIWGLGPAVVAGIDIDLSADTFDTYRFEKGEFETDFEKLWDAFREGRKGDSYTLRLEDPVYEELDDLWNLSPTDVCVLKEQGITTPDQLKSADLEAIVGEATWTAEVRGEETERHGEIEPEDVDALRRDFDPIIVVEINGEDVIDADHPRKYPRARPRTRDWDWPELETEATVALNARDFSRSFRAANESTDAVFLGAMEDVFILHAEDDTDEVHATPEAAIDGGNAGGLYSSEYLRSLRLSIDRPASTELTLLLPEVEGDSDNPHLLGAEYEISKSGEGKADVSAMVAPKIAGADDDDWEGERSNPVAAGAPLPDGDQPSINARCGSTCSASDVRAAFPFDRSYSTNPTSTSFGRWQ